MRSVVPDISYIVSCYNRPELLPICLHSLKVQTHKNFEVIVTDNAKDSKVANRHKQIVAELNQGDGRFRYLKTNGKDCYWSAETGVKKARGNWYCFPCDDIYYVPQFGHKLLSAAVKNQWDFVTAGRVIIGPDACGFDEYHVWRLGRPLFPTGKAEFLIKANRFRGFPGKAPTSVSVNCDRVLGQQIMFEDSDIPWGVVDEVLLVHN
jgi:glycosyltransferase involved in cell wall biosynthesis